MRTVVVEAVGADVLRVFEVVAADLWVGGSVRAGKGGKIDQWEKEVRD